ncbi:Rad3-related DNA helicases [Zymobacter palmae]|uniref:Rad3-related DNA helicases n=1 Tax=Zymobacter palmae TaxID=33074 RepID=A0A348HDF9_9GAMM|nr:Rad3-related DNA helicases [Zymobacter palmae]
MAWVSMGAQRLLGLLPWMSIDVFECFYYTADAINLCCDAGEAVGFVALDGTHEKDDPVFGDDVNT